MSRAPPAWPRPDGGGGASAPTSRSPSGPPSRVGARPQRARVRPPSSAPPWGRSTGHRRTAASQAARATAPEAQGAARSARSHCADASHPGPRARVRCSGRVTARSSAGQSSSPPRHPRSCDPALTTRSPERAASRSDPGPTGASLPDRPRSDDQQPAPWLASAPHGAPAYPLFNNPGILNPSPSPGARIRAAFTQPLTEPLSAANLTLRHVRFVFFEFSPTALALKNTLLLGVLAATAGTMLALVASYLVTRKLVWGHSLLGFLATAPIAIPGIVLGVALFLAYTRGPFVLYGTIWILLLAYLTIELPPAYQQLQSAFRSLSAELEDAGRILGAGRLRALKDITAPLLRTGIVAAWCFIFIGVMRELSAAIMLFTAETKVLPVVIYDLNESGDLGAISVLGLMLLAITFAVTLIANRLPGAHRSSKNLSLREEPAS